MSKEERLLRSMTKGDAASCWAWNGHTQDFGHGRLTINGRRILAHRLAWEIYRGPIPLGMCVLHHCDNPPCCNPDHLYVGTRADNAADCHRRGRHRCNPARGEAAGKSKLTAASVIAIRRDTRKQAVIAAEYGVNPASISRAKRHLNWRHIP